MRVRFATITGTAASALGAGTPPLATKSTKTTKTI